MNQKYWQEFYKKKHLDKPSSFAQFVRPLIKGRLIELGCGNCRDLAYFSSHKTGIMGIDSALAGGITVESWIKYNKSPDYVYTRFFWHAIERATQLAILKWTKKFLFIEARTTEDKKLNKVFDNHKRNYVNVPQLVKDLKGHGFQIIFLKEGRGMSKFGKEDPHLVRVIALK